MKIFQEISASGFDRGGFQVKQVFAPSKDGTEIPTFIVRKKGIHLDGSHPALLYGYGGFNVSLTPSFNVSRIVLTKNLGFVFCLANIRGGGENGEEWHDAATLSKKQNCFDDFIEAMTTQYILCNSVKKNPQTNPTIARVDRKAGHGAGCSTHKQIQEASDRYGFAAKMLGVYWID